MYAKVLLVAAGVLAVVGLAFGQTATCPDLAPGKTCTMTLTVTPPAGTAPGQYPVYVTATNSVSQKSSGVQVLVTVTTPPPPPGSVTLTLPQVPAPGREMTFNGTYTGTLVKGQLTASVDNKVGSPGVQVPIDPRYVTLDTVRKKWSAKATGLYMGDHTFIATAGGSTVTASFKVLK